LDIYSLLKQDHQRVRMLFGRIETEEPGDGATNLHLFDALKRELTIHKEAEESTLYAALGMLPGMSGRIEEALEEHAEIEELLEELAQLDRQSDAFTTQLGELREEVEHHFDAEESEIFAQAQDLLTDEQADRLALQMQAEKERLTLQA
jgi:hemerythrin superfamily protein